VRRCNRPTHVPRLGYFWMGAKPRNRRSQYVSFQREPECVLELWGPSPFPFHPTGTYDITERLVASCSENMDLGWRSYREGARRAFNSPCDFLESIAREELLLCSRGTSAFNAGSIKAKLSWSAVRQP